MKITTSHPPEIGVPHVEVDTPDGWVDLHSFADFVGLDYRTDGEITLAWKSYQKSCLKMGTVPIKEVYLKFYGCSYFEVRPGDPSIPKSEEKNMDFFEVQPRDGGQLGYRFVFGTEAEIIVTSGRLEIQYEKE